MTTNGSTTDVRALRNSKRLNQSEFWQRLGVTQSGGSRYETGRRIPKPVKMLLDLAYGTAGKARTALHRLRGI